MQNGLTISRLAARTGVHLETIRYYERIGLMPEPERNKAGHRRYESAHEDRLSFILRARQLGFGLENVRSLLDLASTGQRSCERARAIAQQRLEEVRMMVTELTQLEATLSVLVQECGSGASSSCAVLDLLADHRDVGP